VIISIGELFTDAEIRRAVDIFEADDGKFHERLLHEIVEPVMPRIAETTGQENNANYMAYVLEYAVVAALTEHAKEP